MIKTQKLVPEVYYKHSRDFQLLGRTFDFIFNHIKLNTENIYNNPISENFDNKLVDLTSTTLGFKQVHEYNTKQLSGLCTIFAIALKNKGNIQSIRYLLNLIGNVQNTTEVFTITPSANDAQVLDIFVPASVEDINLIEDVLNYILPAGMGYRILRQSLVETETYEDVYDLDYMKDITVTTKHITQNSQVLQVQQTTPLPVNSDIDVGRIDNTIIADITDNVEGHATNVVSKYVKEEQYVDGKQNPESVTQEKMNPDSEYLPEHDDD